MTTRSASPIQSTSATNQIPSATLRTPSSTARITTLTPTIIENTCEIPAGWLAITVEAGDTLEALAGQYHTGVEVLRLGNCLESEELDPGSTLYVPPEPTQTPEQCGAPDDWVKYSVQRGDTLYHISVMYSTTVKALQEANCMGNSTLLVVGQKLWVPPTTPIYPNPTFPWYIPSITTPITTETEWDPYIWTYTPTFTATTSPSQ